MEEILFHFWFSNSILNIANIPMISQLLLPIVTIKFLKHALFYENNLYKNKIKNIYRLTIVFVGENEGAFITGKSFFYES